MATGFDPNDPYLKLLGLIPTNISSKDSLKNITSKLSSIQGSRSGIEALGGKVKPKTKKGFISTLFDVEKSPLFAPARFVSAGAADILGLAQDTELADYNPFESAWRSAAGEFAVTGGDIIPTEDDDSILKRAAKLGGAFAWDVATDPLNYVGGVGVFSRKGILSAVLGDEKLRRNILTKLETTALTKKTASEVDNILNSLAGKLDMVKEVRAGKYTVGETGQIFVKETGEAISKEVRDDLAARTVANYIADGFTTRGRKGVVDNLTNAIGDKDIADTVFRSLDKELVGGFFLKNPVTGKPIFRLAGGKGRGNIVTEGANRARFKISAGPSGRFGSRDLSGKFGPTYAEYKSGLLNSKELGSGRTLFTDFTNYKQQARLSGIEFQTRIAKLNASMSTVSRARNLLAENEREQFDEQVKYFFHNKPDDLVDAPPISKMARDAASELRANLDEAMIEFKELNIELGYQENFSPLMYTDKYIDWLMKYDPRIGPEYRGRYRGDKSRLTYTEPTSVVDDGSGKTVNGVAVSELKNKNPMEANKVTNKVSFDGEDIDVFETDPIKLVEKYTMWAARTLTVTRFAKGLEAAGVAIRVSADTLDVVNLYNAVHMASAIGKASTEGGQALRERLRQQKQKLKDMVSADTVRQREAQRAGMVATAQTAFDEAQTRMVEAAAYLRQLNRDLVALEPSVKKLQKLVLNKDIRKQYRGIDSVQELVNRFAKDVKQAKTRLTVAEGNATISARIDELTRERGTSGSLDVFDPQTGKRVEVTPERASRQELSDSKKVAKEDVKKTKLLENELLDETEDLRSVQESLNSLKQSLERTAELYARDEFNSIRTYLNVLEKKNAVYSRINELYRPARETAKDNLSLLKRDIAMPRADAISQATFAYITLHRKHLNEVMLEQTTAPTSRTLADKNRLKASRAALKDAKENLWVLISDVDPNRTAVQTAGRAYVKEIIRMADNLSVKQFEAAFAFADSKKLDKFIEVLGDPNISHATRMQANGDMMAAYRNMRQYVDEDQLRTLTDYERHIYNDPSLVFQNNGDRFTAKINALRDDLQAAINRNDTVEADKIRNAIDNVEFLTQEKGIKMLGAGTVKLPRSLEDMYAPLGIRNVLERLHQIEKNTSEWESFIGRVYDPLSLVWRTASTVGRGPGYTMTNLIGGLLNNWLGGVSAKHHAIAGKILHAYDRSIKETYKQNPDIAFTEASDIAVTKVRNMLGELQIGDASGIQVFEDFLQSGIWMTTDVMAQAKALRERGLLTESIVFAEKSSNAAYEFVGDPSGPTEAALRRTVNALLTWRGQSFMNQVNQNTEMFLRLSAYISGYERFGSKFSAVDNVMLLHFDYQDLSDAEQWMKRFVPFYTWTRNNIPLQLRAAFLQQDKIRKLIVLNENIKDAFGADGNDSWLAEVLPDYIDVSGGFASTFKFAGNNLAFFPKTPIQDVDKLFSMGSIWGVPIPVPRLQEAAGMLGPAVTPLEFITNTNFNTGQKFRSNTERVEQLGKSLIPYLGTAQNIASGLTIPATLLGADLSGVPLIKSEKGLSSLLNFLVGAPYGSTTITEKTLLGGLIQTSNANAKQLTALAAEAKVDVKWLRKQIRKGVSVQQLRSMIARGEGNVERLQRIAEIERFAGKQKGLNQNYADIISKFGSGEYGGF